MATSIVPLHGGAGRPPRLAFPANSPQLYSLYDELCGLMEQYAAYLYEQTGECWTPAELAQELTLCSLAKEASWDFGAWVAKNDGCAGETYYLARPSWSLRFEGFKHDAVWCVHCWAEYSAANGCPMTPGDVVRSVAFLRMADDEDCRAWRLSRRGGVQ